MPSAYSSMHQYPSVQTMRLPGGRQMPANFDAGRKNGLEDLETSDPSILVQDFQEGHHTSEQGRAKPAHTEPSGRLRTEYIASDLDLHQRSIHVPTRTSSRNGPHPSSHSREHNDSVSTTPVSSGSSRDTYDTHATSVELTPLQTKGPAEETDQLNPLQDYDPGSFDLVPPPLEGQSIFSLEARSQQLFSREHLQVIFSDPALLLRFTAFLSAVRPESVPILIYYLDALKALKALAYANAIAEGLDRIPGHEFTDHPTKPTVNSVLEEKASNAFEVLVNEDLPAYITHKYIQIVSLSITRRITGTLAPHLREASEGLAEVFCLSDPSRPDNPIVFASEEFHRTTQYGMSYAIGRNCRFLQGPRTSPYSVRRIRQAIAAGKEHCEVFVNYRRDGSPFVNLLMIAPLCDSRGKIRYFIGAQVDVSGLVKDCTDLESLERLVIARQSEAHTLNADRTDGTGPEKDEFQQLSEMLNMAELDTVKRWGGSMHREHQEKDNDIGNFGGAHKPRLLLKERSPDLNKTYNLNSQGNGQLSGVYQHYLLVRPYPSLRILFASPSLRVPGILQSPFMDKIGGSTRVQEELTAALAEGRGVTAKVRWVTKFDGDGRNRWIHCTPLLGSNGHVGVWMIVLVDDDKEFSGKWKQAPPVNPNLGKSYRASTDARELSANNSEYFPDVYGGTEGIRGRSTFHEDLGSAHGGSVRSASPYSLQVR